MFGIGAFEFLVIAVIALLVLGPEKLPRYAADAGRYMRTLRRMASNAQDEVRRELGPDFQDISLQDLNPRTFVSKHLLDGDDFDLDLRNEIRKPGRNGGAGRGSSRSGATRNGSTRNGATRNASGRTESGRTGAQSTAPAEPAERDRPDTASAASTGATGAGATVSDVPVAAEDKRPTYDADAT